MSSESKKFTALAADSEAIESRSSFAESSPESIEELSHNLSGPVTSILVNCEMLLDGDCPPPVRRKLEVIFAEATEISRQLRRRRCG